MENFKNLIYNLHDVGVNQKYGENLPYSFHLKMVVKQYEKFQGLLVLWERELVLPACILHDTLEDARLSYNDVIEIVTDKLKMIGTNKPKYIADIVYAVTDFKGRNREERKPAEYYEELRKNELALFVKLCDMIANKYYSAMTNSDMLTAYNKEFPKFKEATYNKRFEKMFNLLQSIQ